MAELKLKSREQIDAYLNSIDVVEPKETIYDIKKRLKKEMKLKAIEEDRVRMERLKYLITSLSKTIVLEENKKKIEKIIKILE